MKLYQIPFFPFFLLSTVATANPLTKSPLSMRNPPKILDGFSAIEHAQILQGIEDACTLAKAGLNVATSTDPIFIKYFPPSAALTVNGVLKSIVGAGGKTCASLLTDLTIRPDYADEKGKMSCNAPDVMAATRDGEEDYPSMILCKPGLAYGGIDKSTPGGPAPVTCDTIGERVTWKMDTLGAIILHEYTHFGNLVYPSLGQGTGDTMPDDDSLVYGCVNVQSPFVAAFDAASMLADSYAWFATEAFWTAHCNTQYGKSQPHDDKDPNCGDVACSENDSDLDE